MIRRHVNELLQDNSSGNFYHIASVMDRCYCGENPASGTLSCAPVKSSVFHIVTEAMLLVKEPVQLHDQRFDF